jgi:hypothetical protein
VSCPHITSLGVYVLGAVDDAERELIDDHVGRCAECGRELERLMPLPRYLACLAPDDVLRLDDALRAPAGLLTRLRAAVSAEHRRLVRQRAVAVAAVMVTLSAGTVAVLQSGDRPPAPAPASRAAAADPRSGVRAAVVVSPRAWGTALSVRMHGAAPGERCRLVVLARDGRSELAATWRATYRGTAEVTGSAAIPRADVAAVDVVTTAGRRLVHVPIPEATRPRTQEDTS